MSAQTNTKKITREFSLLRVFPGSVRMVAFVAITLAGFGSNFGSLDFDELSSPDYGVELSALPAAFEGSESALARRKEPVPRRNEWSMLSRRGPLIARGMPRSLQNLCCWYKHIPERGPPLLL
jgi:hypothetical protein